MNTKSAEDIFAPVLDIINEKSERIWGNCKNQTLSETMLFLILKLLYTFFTYEISRKRIKDKTVFGKITW